MASSTTRAEKIGSSICRPAATTASASARREHAAGAGARTATASAGRARSRGASASRSVGAHSAANPGPLLFQLRARDPAQALGRVGDPHPVALDAIQDHPVVGAPVDDRGHRQRVQPVGGGLHGAHAQPDLLAAALEPAQARAVRCSCRRRAGSRLSDTSWPKPRQTIARHAAPQSIASIWRTNGKRRLSARRRLGDLGAVLGDGQARDRRRRARADRGRRPRAFGRAARTARSAPRSGARTPGALRAGAWKSAASSRSSTTGSSARTVAVRGEPWTSASSPNGSPACSVRTRRPSTQTPSRPRWTMYIASAGSPCASATSPSASRRSVRRGRELGQRRAVERGEVRVHAQEVAERRARRPGP